MIFRVTLKVKVKGQLLYFFVNESPPKLLVVATSNLQVHMSYDVEGTGQHFV